MALMSVFNLVFSATEDLDLEPVTVAISAPADDRMAQVLTSVVRDLDGTDELDVTVHEVDEAAGRQQVEDGDAAIALLVPTGFGAGRAAGRAGHGRGGPR